MAGETTGCPHCGTTCLVPEGKMIRYKCSECRARLESPYSMGGKEDECPLCGSTCLVPIPGKMGSWALLGVGHPKKQKEPSSDGIKIVETPPTERKCMGCGEALRRSLLASGGGAAEAQVAPDGPPEAEHQSKLTGIWGWLVIPGSALLIAPVGRALLLVVYASSLTNNLLLWLAYTIQIGMMVATIVVAVLFFKKRRVAVPAIIGLMVASFLESIVEALMILHISGAAELDGIKHAGVFAAIWIPYFLTSKRVKNTFVE